MHIFHLDPGACTSLTPSHASTLPYPGELVATDSEGQAAIVFSCILTEEPTRL